MRASLPTRWRPALLCLAALVAAAMLLGSPAQAQMGLPTGTGASAQSGPELPDVLTREGARELLSTLSDSEVRQLLLDRLDAVAEAQEAAPDAGGGLAQLGRMATVGVAQSVADAVIKLPALGAVLARAWQGFLDRIGAGGLAFMLTVISLAVTGALIVEVAFRRMVRAWVEDIDLGGGAPNLRQTMGFLGKRLTSDLLAVLVFFIAAQLIGTTVAPLIGPLMIETRAQGMVVAGYVAPIWANLVVLPRLAAAVGRFMLAPERPAFRIVQVRDEDARGIYRHQIGLALVLGLGFWAPGFVEMSGQSSGDTRLGFWLDLAFHAYAIWIIWHFRTSMRLMMRGPDPEVSPAEAWAARVYPYFVIASVVLTFWLITVISGYGRLDLLRGAPHVPMILLIAFAPAMDTVVRGLVRHLMPPMKGEGTIAERAWHATRSSYIRVGRVIVFALVVLGIARIWSLDLTNIAAAGVGVQFAANFVELLITLAIGYLLYELVSLWINRKLAAEQTASGYDPDNADFGGDGGGTGGSRLSTVLPLILLVSRSAIVTIFTLLALGTIGVDTTPLLAGAGIVGLAIGFGAQKLVADVVSGIFFLVDDAFRTGEYVTIDSTMGTVEKISIRSMQLRHHKGPVHTIPYGEIPKITNYSRDWVIMKLRFTVPFGTDPNKVKKIFKTIGQEMLEDPEIGKDFLQPFKSQGVLEIDDVGIVIRGKFMSKPGKQFMIRKEIFNRVSAAFAEAGIEFARREVRVALPERARGEELSDEDKRAISAAATQAAQEQLEAGAGHKDDR